MPPLPPPAAAHLSARERHTVRRVMLHEDCLMLIRRGTKRWGSAADGLLALPGSLLLAPRGIVADITNEPDGGGVYEALVMSFPPELVAESPSASPSMSQAQLLPTPGTELLEAIERACRSLIAPQASPRLRWLRAAEVLELLDAAGLGFAPTPLGRCDQVRRLLGSDPAHPWSLPEVAARLALGESTLRRHLAREGWNFTALLRELRLAQGLALLQGSTRPITRIALDVGFQSPSRFSRAFAERFGFLPSVLRREEAASAPPT